MSTEKYRFKIRSNIRNLPKSINKNEIHPIQNRVALSRLRAYELIRSIENSYDRHRTSRIKNCETIAAEAELYKAKINFYKRKLEEHISRNQWIFAKRDANLIEQFSDKIYNLYLENFNIENSSSPGLGE